MSTDDLLVGLAVRLAQAGVGAWKPTEAYSTGDTAIVLGIVPQSPDRVIALSAYPVSDDLTLSDSVTGVQVRYRTGPQSSDLTALTDAVFDALHGAEFHAGPVRVVQCWRNSGAPLGADEVGRLEAAENYYLTTWSPSTYRE